MLRHRLLGMCFLVSTFATRHVSAEPEKPGTPTSNAMVTALAFSHHCAKPKALTPGNDRALKVALISALAGDSPGLKWDAVADFFDKAAFLRLVEGRKVITLDQMESFVKDGMPASRLDMHETVRKHADLLATQFDMIDPGHHEAADQLAAWIAKNYQADKPLGIIIICTGNSRRSMLGSTMGNIATAYYGMPNVRFASGGTSPTAFNSRTIATLKEIGVEINASGREAPRGKGGDENPVYTVRWGKGLETFEFSKLYTDAGNPQKDFAAILVCSAADDSCPKVQGASVRIPVPYLDPKAFDGAPFEAAKYAERRDDMGRFMLNVLLQARRCLEVDGRFK